MRARSRGSTCSCTFQASSASGHLWPPLLTPSWPRDVLQFGRFNQKVQVKAHTGTRIENKKPKTEASEQPSLTSIKPPEVSKSYTIVGVSILSHIHPGADAADGKFPAEHLLGQQRRGSTPQKPLFPYGFEQMARLARRC